MDQDPRWKQVRKARYRNAFGEDAKQLFNDLLHTDEFSFPDNCSKKTVTVVGAIASDGSTEHATHIRRVLRHTPAEIKAILEGRVDTEVDTVNVAAASNAYGYDSSGDEEDEHHADDGGAHSGDAEDQDGALPTAPAPHAPAGTGPAAAKPRPELTAMRMLTKCKRLPNGMGLTLRWIRQTLCPCLRRADSAEKSGAKCVNPIKCRLAHAQAKCNRHRHESFVQRDQLEQECGAGALTCDCEQITCANASGVQVTALACTPGSPCRRYTGDLRGALKTFVCSQVRFHSSELLACDVTQTPLPATEPGKKYATLPHASAHRVCHHRERKRCGIDNSSVFSGITVVKLPGGGVGARLQLRGKRQAAGLQRLSNVSPQRRQR